MANVRAYLHQCVTSTTAILRGRTNAPSDYVSELIGALDTFAPYIAKKALPGYGPLRARYGVELLREAVPLLDALDAQSRAQRMASKGHRDAVTRAEKQRAFATVAFRAVLSGDGAPDANLGAATPKSHAKADRIQSAEELAAEVERVQGDVPAELLDDAGLTADVLGALSDKAGAATESGSVRADKASARQLLRAQLAEPCGRMRHELRVLLAAARAARKLDPNVPQFTSSLLNHDAADKREDEPAPDPAPTPANG